MHKRYRLPYQDEVRLEDLDPKDTFDVSKEEAEAECEKLKEELADLQDKLFAEKKHAVLVILQGMDCSGKDGVVKKALSGINPGGFRVVSFKKPSAEETSHDFLWRVHPHTPAKGQIAVFNRSHYEDVLVPSAHGLLGPDEVEKRLKHIRSFEEMLTDEGTTIVKLFLHISKDYQMDKINERLADPNKHWKFDPSDLQEREYWDEYQKAYERIFRSTGRKESPWYWVPANRRWYRNVVVLRILVHTLKKLDPQYPEPVREKSKDS